MSVEEFRVVAEKSCTERWVESAEEGAAQVARLNAHRTLGRYGPYHVERRVIGPWERLPAAPPSPAPRLEGP